MSLVRFRPEAPFCGFSSFGRAPPCQGGGGGFEPRNPLQTDSLGSPRLFFIFARGSNEFEIHSSRIVVSYRRRKSAALLTPCFVSHRSLKQHSVVLASLTRNPLQKILQKMYHFLQYFFIQVADLVYLLFVGRTRRMTQDTASGMHHALACISSALWAVYHHRRCIPLRLDDILARKRDILVFGRMICNFCEIDDIQGYALILI